MRRTRKAKIVATLGPASSSPAAIRALFESAFGLGKLVYLDAFGSVALGLAKTSTLA